MRDAIDAIVRVSEQSNFSGEVYHAGSGVGISLKDLGALLSKIVGASSDVLRFGDREYRASDLLPSGEPISRVLDLSSNIPAGWKSTVGLEAGFSELYETILRKDEQ
jgi:nucleoside-diphosphate-sugar epimerase